MSESTRAELVRPSAPLFDDARLAVGAFLARYGAPTRTSVRVRSAGVVRVVRQPRAHRVRGATTARGVVGAGDGRGPRPRQGHRRAPAVDPGGLLPGRGDRRTHRALAVGVRAPPQDLRRVADARLGPHGTGRVHRPRRRRRCHRPRAGLPARTARVCGSGRRARSTSKTSPSNAATAPSPCSAKAPSSPSSPCRPASAGPWTKPPATATHGPLLLSRSGRRLDRHGRHPHRPPPGQTRRDRQAHLPALPAPQLHHRRPRRRRSRSETSRSPPATPTPEPPPATTAPATTWTATPATSSPPSSPEPRDDPPCTRQG